MRRFLTLLLPCMLAACGDRETANPVAAAEPLHLPLTAEVSFGQIRRGDVVVDFLDGHGHQRDASPTAQCAALFEQVDAGFARLEQSPELERLKQSQVMQAWMQAERTFREAGCNHELPPGGESPQCAALRQDVEKK